MKMNIRLVITLLLIIILPVISHAAEHTDIHRGMLHCASIADSLRRLTCFDELARQLSSANKQAQSHDYIQPPASFLESRLVANAWKAEYTLTVQSFVDLITHAVMENKKPITVQGWTRDKADYILHITMKSPVNLHFKPRDSAKGNTPMSLLREVRMDGYTMSAWQFILTIAAMLPDENNASKK